MPAGASPETISSLNIDELTERVEGIEDSYTGEREDSPRRRSQRKRAEKKLVRMQEALEEASELPSGEKVRDIYENAVSSERVALGTRLLNRALKENGGYLGDTRVQQYETGRPVNLAAPENNPPDSETPQVWFTHVKKKEGFFRNKEVTTDEVVVVSRFHNSEDGNENNNTVIVRLAKQKNGELVSKSGFGQVMTQEQYQKIISSNIWELNNQEKLVKKMLSGEVDIEQHRKNYKMHMRKTPAEFQKERDDELENTQGRWRSKHEVEGMINKLERDYTEQLQVVNEALEGIRTEVQEEEEALSERLSRVRASPGYQRVKRNFMSAVKNGYSTESDWESALKGLGEVPAEIAKFRREAS